jgi:hypothetical protein
MALQIAKYVHCASDKNNIIAIVSFYIPEWGLYLNDCKYVRKKNGGFFIGFPSRKVDVNGEDKYFNYFAFEGEAGTRFQSAAQRAIEEHIKQNQGRETVEKETPNGFDIF